jgi:glycosyltransferase involved in cell wall biosynthesis
MKISCIIVSYNNGKLLEEAIMSVVNQTRPPDEIIVADDASTDESRERIEALARTHPVVRPIFRERNLGVAANRDLATREASGDFVTYLDGDDHFLPKKIEAEIGALGGHRDVIAFSDVMWVHRRRNLVRERSNADFATLGAPERIRWLLNSKKQSPAAMLIPRDTYLRIGGYKHNLRTYEDWDIILRLAAQPLRWAHSGTTGLVHHPGGGLSRQGSFDHMRDELRVLRLNEEMIRRHVGLPYLLAKVGRLVAVRSKWAALYIYWDRKRWLTQRLHRDAAAS